MNSKPNEQSAIHRVLFMTAKQAHTGIEHWFVQQKIGITPLQFGVLRSVPPEGSTLNDLARRMMFKPPSILPSIDSLEKQGYMVRNGDPHDKRKIRLLVTAKGKRVVDRILKSKKLDPLGAAFKKMDEKVQKQLIDALQELQNLIAAT